MKILVTRPLPAFALAALCLAAGSAFAAAAAPADFDTQLLSIQQQWAHVNYELEDGEGGCGSEQAREDQRGEGREALQGLSGHVVFHPLGQSWRQPWPSLSKVRR